MSNIWNRFADGRPTYGRKLMVWWADAAKGEAMGVIEKGDGYSEIKSDAWWHHAIGFLKPEAFGGASFWTDEGRVSDWEQERIADGVWAYVDDLGLAALRSHDKGDFTHYVIHDSHGTVLAVDDCEVVFKPGTAA